MNTFFPVWFKVIQALFIFIVIYKIFLYFVMSKLIKRVVVAPDEEKAKAARSFSRVLPAHKILFWMAPLVLILVPILIYIYSPDGFIEITVSALLMYIVVLEDYFYRKTILRRIGS